MEATSRISQLNDEFRRALLDPKRGSRGLYLTAAIARRPLEEQSEIINRVLEFDDFTRKNDPYGEHDFGAFEFAGERILWKIDCYVRIPVKATMHSGAWRPLDPVDDDQGGA